MFIRFFSNFFLVFSNRKLVQVFSFFFHITVFFNCVFVFHVKRWYDKVVLCKILSFHMMKWYILYKCIWNYLHMFVIPDFSKYNTFYYTSLLWFQILLIFLQAALKTYKKIIFTTWLFLTIHTNYFYVPQIKTVHIIVLMNCTAEWPLHNIPAWICYLKENILFSCYPFLQIYVRFLLNPFYINLFCLMFLTPLFKLKEETNQIWRKTKMGKNGAGISFKIFLNLLN